MKTTQPNSINTLRANEAELRKAALDLGYLRDDRAALGIVIGWIEVERLAGPCASVTYGGSRWEVLYDEVIRRFG